ncbi:MAG: glycosyltransferase family 4 protein [Patescibacteria group bacterium]
MRLAIDGYEANAQIRVGVGRYAFELIAKIAKMQQGSRRVFDEVTVYLPEPKRPHMPEASRYFTYKVCFPKKLWTFIGFPLALATSAKKPDVVFSPTHYLPRFVNIPRVIAVMDVSYLSYPELFRREDLHKLIHWTAYSVRHAARIITISEFSKRAIIEAYHVPADRVTVAYPALTDWQNKLPMATTETTRNTERRYILTVGTLQPRKNFTRLIEAFSKLKETDISLVIVGKKGWLYEEILAAPKRFGVEHRVKFMDFVPDDELPELYKNAACFVLPSLYEGFGLPVLEAMSYGIPVVVSNVSSLPEIAGDAGIYVEPENVESITRGLETALTEKSADRTKRITGGKKRAAEFTWERAADQVMRVLSEAAAKGDT